ERRTRGEEVGLGRRKLARRLGVEQDRAGGAAVLAEDGHGDERLEALLLELGDVLDTRVRECVLPDECGLAVLERPPREPLAALERDLADQVLVRLARGPEHQAPTAVLDEVDEAS